MLALAAATASALTFASLGSSVGLPPQIAPIKAVILIDESGSLDQPAVAAERNAAAVLALGELSSSSQFAIDGFGSSNQPGQNAVTPYCDFITVADHVARERLAQCARRAHRRSPAQGNDTDQAAALAQAVDQLSNTPSTTTPVIFLMTDGVLDVSHSPQYGKDAALRDSEATRQIRQQVLPDARRAGVQIWALGFGPQVSKPALDAFARGGAGSNSHCAGSVGARPAGIVVGTSSEVIYGLLRTLGRARCAQVEPPASGRLEPGKTLTLKVHIPVIATDGAITVTKIDPSFKVKYYDPQGHQAPATGTIYGETFELSGASGDVEALRIREPIPGTWVVKVTDPAGHPGQTVAATAVWEGALQGAISVVPGAPVPLKPAVIRVSLLTRRGLIRSAAALAGVRATATVSGNFGSLDVPLRDDGRPPDDHANDGVFAGTLILPKGAVGNVTAVGRISGAGVASDERHYFFKVGGPDVPGVVIEFSPAESVHPGATLSGLVDVSNSGRAQSGSLELTDVSSGALITVSPTSIPMPAGQSAVPFKVGLAKDTPRRDTTFTIRVTDANGTRNDVIASVRVTTPPGLISRFWWIPLILFALVAGLAIALRIRQTRITRASQVRGLVAELQRRGMQVASLDAPLRGTAFAIDVVDDVDSPRLRHSTGAASLTATRAPPGVSIEGPTVERSRRRFGEEIVFNDALTLVFSDQRTDANGSGRGVPATVGISSASGFGEPPTGTDDSDELL
jgi:hypothetical protein